MSQKTNKKPEKATKKKDGATQDPEKMMKAVVLLSLGAFLFFFYVSLSGFQALVDIDSPSTVASTEVLGASTAPEAPVVEYVDLMVNNANIGEAVLELHMPSAMALAGAEFHFELEDTLEFEGVICSSQFVCIDEYEDGVFHLSIFRLPDQANIPLSGVVKAATLIYSESSYGEMTLNGGNTEASMIVELGSDENLLSEEVQYFAVGRRAY